MKWRANAEAYKHEAHPRSSKNPSVSISHIHQEAHRLCVLLLLRTLDLCRTSESLLSVLALLACNPSHQYDPQIPYCILQRGDGALTYAVVCWASQSSLQHQHELICSGAQISSTPLGNRRRERNQLSFHHRIEFADRKH